MLRPLFALALIAATAPTSVAAPTPAAPTPPSCSAAEFHQLDFWLGDWDTLDSEAKGSTTSIARTHVDLIAGGCAVHELYEQTDGLIGDSILSYDAVRKQWQQTWVTNRGAIMVIYGNFKGGALVLEGEVHRQDGQTIHQRITWKAEGKGVRESAVMSKDGRKTWAPAFDVLFVKHPAS
jgi:hypothetical protein